MNEQERSELERLKQRQARLQEELSLLAGQLKRLEAQLTTPAVAPPPAPAPVVRPMGTISAPVPAQVKRIEPQPIPVPPIIATMVAAVPVLPKSPQPISAPAPKPVAASQVVLNTPPATPLPLQPPAPSVSRPGAAPEAKASFEMRLGTYWLVRIGAVLVLTGLVFFGNLAYQNLGARGKVALLYLASGLLLGAGAWWQRQTVKESLRNYAQVLFAGGLAAVYFTTYAAHHVPTLRVITSSLLDGALLLAWAALIAWIADRRKSELLALFAVGLAYYASVITPVGSFTLFSNLVLTIAAVFFLVRNRWAGLSWASLLATYAAYAYWRFYHGGEGWRWVTPNEGLWFGASFLWSYWLLFTIAVFLSQHESIAGERRAAFVTFNNGAMFTLFLLTMLQVHHHRFWQFSLGYGAVLLALAELARRFLAAEPITKNTYLTQGLLLVTVGFISKFIDQHQQLALVLAAESVILFILGTLRKNIFLQTGAYLTGALAVAWGIDAVERGDTRGLWLGSALGGLMLLNAYWSHWRSLWADRRELRPVPAYFTLLALIIWAFTTWQNTSHANFGLVMAIEALALTLSVYALGVPEIPLLGMGYIVLAQLGWSFDVPRNTALKTALLLVANGAALMFVGLRRQTRTLRAGAYVTAALAVAWGIAGLERDAQTGLFVGTLIGVILAAGAWWMHQRSVESNEEIARPAPSYLTALALLMWIATTWFNTRPENFPLALAVEAAVLTASVHFLRVREFALLGQGLLVLGQVVWLTRFVGAKLMPPWWNPALLIALTLGLSHWWQRQKVVRSGATLSNLCQTLYSLALVALICVWLEPHNSPSAWIVVTSVLAVSATAYGVATRAWPLAICGQIFLLASGAQLVTRMMSNRPEWYFPLAPIVALGLLSFATWQWFALKTERKPQVRSPLLQLAMIYRWVALVMSLWWVCEYIRERERVWVFALVGVLVFIFAGWRRSREAGLFGATFTLAGLTTLWLAFSRELLVYFPNVLAVLALLGQQQIVRRLPERYELPRGVQSATIMVGSVTLWRLVSDWVLLGPGGLYLTASWSVLAFLLFGSGVVLREKMYRWAGLGLLAAALGRVIVIDVWTLDRIYRVLSFMALGIVLLVLGFIYNKYQEKIRQWL